MSRLRSKFSMLEKRRTVEISRIYTISLTKISTSWVCVLHHRLNYSVKTKTRIRNSLINCWFVKFFINYHRIAETGFIFWVTCSPVRLSTDHLIHIPSSCINNTWLWNTAMAITILLGYLNLFRLSFSHYILLIRNWLRSCWSSNHSNQTLSLNYISCSLILCCLLIYYLIMNIVSYVFSSKILLILINRTIWLNQMLEMKLICLT